MAITDQQVLSLLPTSDVSFVRGYVEYASQLVPSPLIFHVGAALGLMASVCPMNLWHSGHVEMDVYPNLWPMLIGPSATGKTQAINIARKIMAEAIRRMPQKCSPKGGDPRTEEGLLKSLRNRPRQIIIYDDFGSFLGSTAGAHDNNYRAKVRDLMTQVFDCQAYEGEKAHETVVLEPSRLSILAPCTPAHLRTHTTMLDWDNGFMTRFMTFVGEPSFDREDFTPAKPDDVAEFGEWLAKLLAQRADPDHEEALIPGNCVGITPDALAYWKSWQKTIRDYEQSVDVRMAGCVRRVRLMAQKCALILSYDYGAAAMSCGNDWMIELDVMEPACGLAATHAQNLVEMTKTIAVNPDMIICNQIIDALPEDGAWIHRGKLLQKVGLLSRNIRFYLETLQERGEIETTNVDSHQWVRKIEGGKPPEWEPSVAEEIQVADGME